MNASSPAGIFAEVNAEDLAKRVFMKTMEVYPSELQLISYSSQRGVSVAKSFLNSSRVSSGLRVRRGFGGFSVVVRLSIEKAVCL
jgi:hypothetical protein